MKLEEGIDFYYTLDGLMVLTESYHLERGYCCGSGCRHCPFQYNCVPEPRRGELIKSRAANPPPNGNSKGENPIKS
jgi:hypothetical protein